MNIEGFAHGGLMAAMPPTPADVLEGPRGSVCLDAVARFGHLERA